MRDAAAIEPTGTGFSAHVPDLPGRAATGAWVAAVEHELREAIRFHLDGMREAGLPEPEPGRNASECEPRTRLRTH